MHAGFRHYHIFQPRAEPVFLSSWKYFLPANEASSTSVLVEARASILRKAILNNDLPTARKSSYINICKHFTNLNNFLSQIKTQEQARCRPFLAWRIKPMLQQGKWYRNFYLLSLSLCPKLLDGAQVLKWIVTRRMCWLFLVSGLGEISNNFWRMYLVSLPMYEESLALPERQLIQWPVGITGTDPGWSPQLLRVHSTTLPGQLAPFLL